jgi:hypothetical protein
MATTGDALRLVGAVSIDEAVDFDVRSLRFSVLVLLEGL